MFRHCDGVSICTQKSKRAAYPSCVVEGRDAKTLRSRILAGQPVGLDRTALEKGGRERCNAPRGSKGKHDIAKPPIGGGREDAYDGE